MILGEANVLLASLENVLILVLSFVTGFCLLTQQVCHSHQGVGKDIAGCFCFGEIMKSKV